MKRLSDSQNLTEEFFAFLQDITMLKKWFISAFPEIEKISQNVGPKLGRKFWKIESLMKRCIESGKHHRRVFSLFLQDITMLKKWFISAFPAIGKISQNMGHKFRPKIIKNWTLNEKVHRISKTSLKRFSAFLQDITMLKKWFISAFPEIEKISHNCGPEFWPNIIKNWTFNEKVHPIRKTSQSRFPLFCKILRC